MLAGLLVAGCGDSGSTPPPPDLAVQLDLAPAADLVHLTPECDVFMNTGCAAGEKCTVGTQNGTPRDLCFAVSANPVGLGAACMMVTSGSRTGDNCAPGLICEDFPGDGPHCRKPCYTRSNCAGGEGCVLTTPTMTQRQSEAGTFTLKACIADTGCDPVQQNVCTGGRNCYLSPADDVGRVGICLVNMTMGMAGADCMKQVDCAPGFRCNGLGFCRRYCYWGPPDGGVGGSNPGTCPSTEGPCDPFFGGGAIYGICGGE